MKLIKIQHWHIRFPAWPRFDDWATRNERVIVLTSVILAVLAIVFIRIAKDIWW